MRYSAAASAVSTLLFAGSALAQGGGSVLPQSSAGGGPQPSCGVCYIIADIVEVVYDVTTITAVETNSQNATITTDIVSTETTTAPLGGFSYTSSGLIPGGPTQLVTDNMGSIIAFPTPYIMITGYTAFSTITQNGGCVFVSGSSEVAPSNAFPYTGGDVASFLSSAELSFATGIERLSCGAGGATVSTSTSSITSIVPGGGSSTPASTPAQITPPASSSSSPTALGESSNTSPTSQGIVPVTPGSSPSTSSSPPPVTSTSSVVAPPASSSSSVVSSPASSSSPGSSPVSSSAAPGAVTTGVTTAPATTLAITTTSTPSPTTVAFTTSITTSGSVVVVTSQSVITPSPTVVVLTSTKSATTITNFPTSSISGQVSVTSGVSFIPLAPHGTGSYSTVISEPGQAPYTTIVQAAGDNLKPAQGLVLGAVVGLLGLL